MKLKIIALLAGFLFIPLYAQEKLIFALDLIRHGARTPYIDIKIPAYQWPEGPGELLPLGMQQEYQLGLTKRKAYIEEYHLLPTSYQVNSMYVRATDYDRTLMSAEAFLLGLYPLGSGPLLPNHHPALPDRFQVIPVHTTALTHDFLFGGNISKAQHDALLERYVFKEKDWQQKQASLAPNFPRWSKATGLKITNLDELIYVGDALYIRSINGVPLPKGLSKQDISSIIDNGHWAVLKIYQNPHIANAYAHHLLIQLDQYLVAASQAQTPLKYVLWSAHDSTMMAMLGALSAPLDTSVPYAADLNFTLWQDQQNNDWVKVTYNGQVVKIPACHNTNVCSLSEFLAIH